jgi:hypothetical protein
MTVFYICFTIIFLSQKGILMLNRFRGWSVVPGLLLGLVLSGCSGIPLSALPKLMQLSTELADAHPAEFMVALQVDARMVPPPGAVPELHIQLKPRIEGAWPAIDRKLPMQVLTLASSSRALGLEAPDPGRRWLVYSLPLATQEELLRVQAQMRQARNDPQRQSGGSLSVGVAQDSLATRDPVLLNTRWDTWLQTRQRDGFYRVWSGTPAQIHQLAREAR